MDSLRLSRILTNKVLNLMYEQKINQTLQTAGFLRIWQIVGDVKRGIPPLIPISKSAWWNGVKTGRYPAPVKLSPRVTAWKAEDVYALINNMRGAL